MSQLAPERASVQVAYDQVCFWSVVRVVAVSSGGFIMALSLVLGVAAMLGFETVHFTATGRSPQAIFGPQALLVSVLFGAVLTFLYTLAFLLGWALLRLISPLPGITINLNRKARDR